MRRFVFFCSPNRRGTVEIWYEVHWRDETCNKEFPMEHLSEQELSSRGDHLSMTSNSAENGNNLRAVLWMDGERRYFVSSCHTGNTGTLISRE